VRMGLPLPVKNPAENPAMNVLRASSN
jgi:hypothetical protein